jgi:YidC/Oxa1 family membrane protein insertase
VLVGPTPPDAIIPLPDAPDALAASDAVVATSTAPTAGGWIFGKPMALVETLLVTVHDTSGLPWWATIAATTAAVRLAFVPLQIYQSKGIAKMAIIKPQIDELSAKMRESGAKGTEKGAAEAEAARKALSVLFDKHSVRPWMSIVGALGQIPLWLTFFFTMRHIVRADSGLGLDTGGMLWFTDLTAKDPYYALPVICGATFFGMVQLGDAGQVPGQELDSRQQMMRQMMKGAAVLMVPATSWFESGVFIYWISTNCFAMTQTILLRQPVLRDVVGLPPVPAAQAGVLGMTPTQALASAPSAAATEAARRVSLGGSAPHAPRSQASPKKTKKKRGRR